ncbi:uncharacterized protein HMPREF1541_03142 [Cyphellophora europaea CBS 101466]|uniref:Mitochondrial phosphate carrier protein n=1 Tax=Cyphellophora europaea (strain CBS 101466) TaxID=1220924 RepID=W2RXN1_CYPE1|nr:uncharacterized protein HMPREF1541_03142 [Cyphellophora europaea CBS 101466]ETN41207.1 hypothetical protein HMPREF1541_03142 [Cyphellophora europaea CBS 101466]
MLITRGFSLTNFLIGTSALSFQVFVLFPWHEKLEQEFHVLKAEHARLLQEQRSELSAIRTEIRDMIRAEHNGKKGGWGLGI